VQLAGAEGDVRSTGTLGPSH